MNTQWKLVPVEPTETMVINGFESEPDECFTDDEVWEQYQEMSGCQQAAFRAKLCWAAMLGSAPSVPTDGQIEVVAVINEEGEIFKETVVEHRPGIDMLPVGTELVDIAHVIRLTAERDALQLRLNAADQRMDEMVGLLKRCVLAVREQHCDQDEADFDLPTGLMADIDAELTASDDWHMNPCKQGHRDVGAAGGIAHCYTCDEKIEAATTQEAFERWNATHPQQ